MTRLTFLCWLLAALVAALTAFHVSEDTKSLESKLTNVETRIVAELEAIHVLEAEWSYLNQPERIARLAEDHLGLTPLRAEQMQRVETLTFRGTEIVLDLAKATPQPETKQ